MVKAMVDDFQPIGYNDKQYVFYGWFTPTTWTLGNTTTEKDVGTTITDSLKLSKQCAVAVKQSKSVLGQLERGVSYRDKQTFVGLYKNFLSPHLEVNIQSWNPWKAID